MIIREGTRSFEFDAAIDAVKFDETEFYRGQFNCFPSSKGVDILANSKNEIQFIEIKDFCGHESENVWRTSTNNRKAPPQLHDAGGETKDTLDIEVTKKVVSTLACLTGVWAKSRKTEKADELLKFWKGLSDSKIPEGKKKIVVTLVLEGDFNSKGPRSRTKKMMMQAIQESLKNKLSWLNCKVMVVDSDTAKERYFKIS